MKYLKLFENIGRYKSDIQLSLNNKLKNIVNNILFNLSDCLTEIFDKYSIPEFNNKMPIDGPRWWISHKELGSPKIVISGLNLKNSKTIYTDIVKNKITIEKRIKTRIYPRIDRGEFSNTSISIFLSDYTYQKRIKILKDMNGERLIGHMPILKF